MKYYITIICLLVTTMSFGQEVLYGQEMSGVFMDTEGSYSLAELEYDVKGSDVREGDKIYHNEIVVLDEYGYPLDLNYEIRKIGPHKYEVVEIH